MNMLQSLCLFPNDLKKEMMVMIGDVSYQISELLHYENINIDGKQDISIEISIDLISSISKPFLIKLRKQ